VTRLPPRLHLVVAVSAFVASWFVIDTDRVIWLLCYGLLLTSGNLYGSHRSTSVRAPDREDDT
jgi:hypothetical protein